MDRIPTEWNETKPHFYRDFRGMQTELLGDADLTVLITDKMSEIQSLYDECTDGFELLERGMKSAVFELFGECGERQSVSCPYSGMLDRTLGKRALSADLAIDEETRIFLETSLPGGYEAPVLISSLLRRIAEIGDAFQVEIPPAELARNSASLLNEPLNHPQQWARAFMFTLADESGIRSLGNIYTFRRDSFLTPEMFDEHVSVNLSCPDQPRIEWSRPLGEFTLNTDLIVVSRVDGSEVAPTSDNSESYRKGTALKDIATDEDTLGCPGKLIAKRLWIAGVDIAEAQQLWDAA